MQMLSYTQKVQEEITDSEVSINRGGGGREGGREKGGSHTMSNKWSIVAGGVQLSRQQDSMSIQRICRRHCVAPHLGVLLPPAVEAKRAVAIELIGALGEVAEVMDAQNNQK